MKQLEVEAITNLKTVILKKSKHHMCIILLLTLLLPMMTAFSESGPSINLYGDISDYDPEMDGYFAQLPLTVLSGSGASKTFLPSLVWKHHVLVDAYALCDAVPGLWFEENDQALIISAMNRSLIMMAGHDSADYRVASQGSSDPLIYKEFSLSTSPLLYMDHVWLPLTDTLVLMNCGFSVSESLDENLLVVTEPRRNHLDVLADLMVESYREPLIFAYQEQDREAIETMKAATKLSLSFDALVRLDLVTLWRRVWETDIHAFMEQVAAVNKNEYEAMANELIKEAGTMNDLEDIVKELNNVKLSDLKMPGIVMAADMLVADAGTVIWGSIEQWEQRDKLATDAMNLYAKEGKNDNLGELKEAATKAIKDLSSSQSWTISRLLHETPGYVDAVLKTAGELLEKGALTSITGVVGLINAGYSLIESQMLQKWDWWSGSMDRMKAFEVSIYGLMFERDAEELLMRYLGEIRNNPSHIYVSNAVKAAYLYLKSCDVTRESAMKALNMTSPGTYADHLRQTCADNMTVLFLSTEETNDYSLDNLINRAVYVDQRPLLNAVNRWYMCLNGQVMHFDTKAPVQDARVEFTVNNKVIGWFQGTPYGLFREKYVPLGLPDRNSTVLEGTELEVCFTSPTVVGEDRIQIDIEPGGYESLKAAYLGELVGISGIVLDSSTDDPLAGVLVSAEYHGNKVETITDQSGAFLLESLLPGTYTLTFELDNYGTIGKSCITNKHGVTAMPDPVKMIKKSNYVVFGHYEQDNDLSNGPEPIEWIVVGRSENKALLLSRHILDYVPFDDGESHYSYYYSWDSNREHHYNSREWAGCNLRYWLNHNLYEDSFSYKEKNRILKTEVTDGPITDETVWTTVEDSVFVMSASFGELNKTWSGTPNFNSNWDFAAATATPYALARENRAPDGVWYLRDNGGQDCVGSDGQIIKYTYHDGPAVPEGLAGGVRPAICVSLSVLQENK